MSVLDPFDSWGPRVEGWRDGGRGVALVRVVQPQPDMTTGVRPVVPVEEVLRFLDEVEPGQLGPGPTQVGQSVTVDVPVVQELHVWVLALRLRVCPTVGCGHQRYQRTAAVIKALWEGLDPCFLSPQYGGVDRRDGVGTFTSSPTPPQSQSLSTFSFLEGMTGGADRESRGPLT